MTTPPPDTSGVPAPHGPPPVPAAPTPPNAPPTTAGDIGAGRAVTPDATGGVIPYKNPAALIAYYLGIFGLIPVLGLPMAIAAIVLGVAGLKSRAKGRAHGGRVHAWVGIVLGSVSLAYHAAPFVLTLVF